MPTVMGQDMGNFPLANGADVSVIEHDHLISFVTAMMNYADGTDNGSVMTDYTGKTWTANGTARTNTAFKKYGAAGVVFPGTTSSISTPDNADWDLPGDFCYEFWLNVLQFSNTPTVISNYQSATLGLTIAIDTSAIPRINMTGDGSDLTFTSAMVANTWTHLAVNRLGTSLSAWLNGVNAGTVVNSNSVTSTQVQMVGGFPGFSGNQLLGCCGGFRLTKGASRYTSAFTPPTGRFPTA